MSEQYTPSDEQVREAWRAFTGPNRDHGYDRFLARVRRDAWEEGAQHGSRSPGYYPDENPYGYEESP